MTATSALAVSPVPGSSPGRRPPVLALAVSVGLHVAVAAAAVWWPFAATNTPPAAVMVEVAFWSAPDNAVLAAAPQEAPEIRLSTASAPPQATPVIEQVPPQPSPAENVAAPPEPPIEPAPPVAEPAITLFKPPPPKPRRRESAAVRPAPAAVQEVRRTTEPSPNPVETPALAAGPDVVTASPPAPATEISSPAAPAMPAAPSEVAAAPPVITSARFRSPPAPPTYPRRAIDLHQEGEVIVRALVGPDGESRDIRVFRSSGVGLLDDAALRAVRRWAFEAAQINGRPVEAWVEVPVRFQLRSVL